MQLTPREFDKLLVYMMADVALKRKAKGIKLNYPEAVAVISAVALDGARAGKTIEDVTKDARTALTKADVMDGVADLIQSKVPFYFQSTELDIPRSPDGLHPNAAGYAGWSGAIWRWLS